MIKMILKVMGVSKLVGYAWEALKPELEEWAASDGKEDWDDKLVEFLDNIIGIIVNDLEAQGK